MILNLGIQLNSTYFKEQKSYFFGLYFSTIRLNTDRLVDIYIRRATHENDFCCGSTGHFLKFMHSSVLQMMTHDGDEQGEYY